MLDHDQGTSLNGKHPRMRPPIGDHETMFCKEDVLAALLRPCLLRLIVSRGPSR